MNIKVAVCDASRFRYFTVDPTTSELLEADDRVHEASRLRAGEILSDSQGRDRGHSLGDHRSPHKKEEAAFARDVADILNRDARQGQVIRLYILAAPEMLGLLRKELAPAAQAVLEMDKAVNVATEEPAAIRRQLPPRL